MAQPSSTARTQRWRPNVTQKIVGGYLALALFSFGALILALFAIQRQATISRDLVDRDFKAITLIRDLRATLLSQERLERQYLILRDRVLLNLREKRQEEFAATWSALAALDLSDIAPWNETASALRQRDPDLLQLLHNDARKEADEYLSTKILPLRTALDRGLEEAAHNRETIIDHSLQRLYTDSAAAYRFTLILLILGVAIGGGIAVHVVCSIRRSLLQLTHAVRQTAEERFDITLDAMNDDEFGHLASEFVQMGIKLHEFKHLHLDANPLTHLPGNLAISRELDRRIASGESFAHIYIDLDHFKAYGDRYGYQKGSDIIALTGELIRKNVHAFGNPHDLIGHIGGDDYLVLSTPDCAEEIARHIVAEFDEQRKSFYTPADYEKGYYEGLDRFGEKRTFPLISISIAIICSDNLTNPTQHSISAESAKMKEHLKHLPGSNYLVDRRRR